MVAVNEIFFLKKLPENLVGKEESCNFAPAFGNETDAGGCPAAGQAWAQMHRRV